MEPKNTVNTLKIQLNSQKAVSKLIDGDEEIEIEIKKTIVDKLIDRISSRLDGAVLKEINDKIEQRYLSKSATLWGRRGLTDNFKNEINDNVNKCVSDTVNKAVEQAIENKIKTLEKVVERVFNERIGDKIDQLVQEKLNNIKSNL